MADHTAQLEMDGVTSAEVYRWAYRLLQNHDDALDATQEVLLKWLRQPAGGIQNRQAWLRRITTNHCIDRLRVRRTTTAIEIETIDSATPIREAANEELRDHISSALGKLSEKQRTVLVAKVYDRETFASIATSMGISASSVKTHYLRALRAMRKPLANFWEIES